MPVKWLSQHMPFVALVAASQSPKLSGARIAEAVIIAVITGAFATYGVTVRLEERLAAQRQHVDERFSSQDRQLQGIVRDQEWLKDKITDHLMIVNPNNRR